MELFIKCAVCGGDLEMVLRFPPYTSNDLDMEIKPCKTCLEDAFNQGREDEE